MTAASAITGIQKFLNNDLVQRFYKTVLEVGVAQTALYATVIPNAPKVTASVGIAGGAGVLSLLWNGLTAWAASRKNKQLLALQAAIEAAARNIVAQGTKLPTP